MADNKEKVSIIMLSRNSAQFVEESVRSVISQTYQNWELIIMDDNSNDNTVTVLMELKSGVEKSISERIKVSQTVAKRGAIVNMNSALKEARGKWIAFLTAGDIWSPDKLERQIAFMKENGYKLSYTNFGIIDKHSQSRGVVVSGPEVIDEKLMLKCFWPGMLTVMYDAKRIGKVKVPSYKNSNCYALLIRLSERAECHLLDENLASNRIRHGLFNGVSLNKKWGWRYEAYRTVEDLGRMHSALETIQNMWFTMVKRVKYVKKVKE
jgi:glycosyltransferase involved in cell wall biosynthesis